MCGCVTDVSVSSGGDQKWRRKRYGRYGGCHTNLKLGMTAPYQSAEIWAVAFQENHYKMLSYRRETALQGAL